jgi:hypothetical protein
MALFPWWRSVPRRLTTLLGSRRSSPAQPSRLAVELLEDRLVPTVSGALLPAFYQDLLHRAPGPGSVGQAIQLDEGVNPALVAYQIETGPGNEFRSDVVAADYERFLHRPASPTELTSWATQLAVGVTQQQVEAALVGSNEYLVLHGDTIPGFLNGLYVDALSRPDSEGAWTDRIYQGLPRQNVAYAVFTSGEGSVNQVRADYEQYLGRSAVGDPAAAAFAGELARGASNESIVATLLGSPEYAARHPEVDPASFGSVDGSLSSVLLPAFYQDLLHRAPGPGSAGQAVQLDEGVDPAAVAYQIETGPGNEFRADVVAADYERFLRRPASPAELAGWTTQLALGVTQQQLEAALIGSAEYYVLHGGNAGGFLNGLYVDALSRPDSEGAWFDLVNRGADRTSVAYAVLTSWEGSLRQVWADYEQYLGRSGVGDPGAGAFAVELLSGVSHESIVARLLGSQEYIARQQTLIVSAGSGAGESFAQYETQQQQAEAQAQAEADAQAAADAQAQAAAAAQAQADAEAQAAAVQAQAAADAQAAAAAAQAQAEADAEAAAAAQAQWEQQQADAQAQAAAAAAQAQAEAEAQAAAAAQAQWEQQQADAQAQAAAAAAQAQAEADAQAAAQAQLQQQQADAQAAAAAAQAAADAQAQ